MSGEVQQRKTEIKKKINISKYILVITENIESKTSSHRVNTISNYQISNSPVSSELVAMILSQYQ